MTTSRRENHERKSRLIKNHFWWWQCCSSVSVYCKCFPSARCQMKMTITLKIDCDMPAIVRRMLAHEIGFMWQWHLKNVARVKTTIKNNSILFEALLWVWGAVGNFSGSGLSCTHSLSRKIICGGNILRSVDEAVLPKRVPPRSTYLIHKAIVINCTVWPQKTHIIYKWFKCFMHVITYFDRYDPWCFFRNWHNTMHFSTAVAFPYDIQKYTD